jgi:hypothetical protein
MLSTASGRNKVTKTTMRAASPRLLLGSAVLLLCAAACRPDPSTPRGTAERFLDAHYVHIDLPSALPFTSGLARQKVESEIELVRGVEIDEATRKPTVHYTLLEERPDGAEAVSYVYRGRIAVDGADSFERRWLVTVRQEPDGWRVTNYQEFEQ